MPALELDLGTFDGVPTLKSVRKVPDVDEIISTTAEKHGIDPAAFRRMAEIESSLDPNAKAKSSSASGLFQFTKGTAKDYGLADPFDAEANADAAARLWKDNAAGLKKALGRDPTAAELYLAHQQGLGGAKALLSNPTAKAVDVLGKKAVLNNGGTADMTAGDFAAKWINKFSGQAGQVNRAAKSDLAMTDVPKTSPLLEPMPEMTGGKFSVPVSGGVPQDFQGLLQGSPGQAEFGDPRTAPVEEPPSFTGPDTGGRLASDLGKTGELKRGAKLSSKPTLRLSDPIVLKASEAQSPALLARDALQGSTERPVIIDGAQDFGFASDRVIIMPGGKESKVDPEKVLEAPTTPVLTRAMFLKVLKHLNAPQ